MPERRTDLKRNPARPSFTLYKSRGNNVGIIDVTDLRKYFPVRRKAFAGQEWLKAVDGITLSIRDGSVFALVGESGSGKSTVARLVLRLITPTSGKILFQANDIQSLKGEALLQF